MKKTILIILIIVALIVGGVVFAGIGITNSEKNLPNLYVGDIDVSKLTHEETLTALKNGNWDSKTTANMTVSLLGKVDFEVNQESSGLCLSTEAAADAASMYGHDSNLFANLFTYIKSMLSDTDINEIYGVVNDSYIDEEITLGLDYLCEYYGIEEIRLDFENEQLKTIKGWGQINFDKPAMKEAIISGLKNGETKIEYSDIINDVTMPDFSAINNGLEKTTVDAKYSDDGKFEVIDETDACEIDVAEAEKIWNAAGIGDEVIIPMAVTKASVTGNELRDRLFHDLLGAMSTRYTNSAENRCSNVRLCASKINEYILYPGEVFSYNQVVGARTEEAGFLPAPAYVGLDSEETVKDEIGGGACQISSTTYAATLFAFLETVERTCHIYPVNYMQLGIDATVTIPEDGQEVDFKFKNNKNYPIKIVAYTEESDEEKKLTVEIWGTLEDDDYMPVEFDASYTWVQDYDRTIDPAYTNRDGFKIKLEHDTYTDAGESGVITSTQTWRRVYDQDGNLVEEQLTNMPNPATGQPSMDQYHQHP